VYKNYNQIKAKIQSIERKINRNANTACSYEWEDIAQTGRYAALAAKGTGW